MAITHMNCKATVAALARIMHYQFAAITLEHLVRNMSHLNAERRSIERFCRTQHLQLLECERGCCAHSTYEKVVPIIFGFESYCLRLHLSDEGCASILFRLRESSSPASAREGRSSLRFNSPGHAIGISRSLIHPTGMNRSTPTLTQSGLLAVLLRRQHCKAVHATRRRVRMRQVLGLVVPRSLIPAPSLVIVTPQSFAS